MRQLNLPKKYTAMSQVWISVALIILATVFAFTPMISLDLTGNEIVETLNIALEEVQSSANAESDQKITIPEKVDVTTKKVIDAVSILGKIVSVSIKEVSTGTTMTETQEQELKAAREELQAMLESPDGQEAIIMAISLFSGIIDFGGEDAKKPNTPDTDEVNPEIDPDQSLEDNIQNNIDNIGDAVEGEVADVLGSDEEGEESTVGMVVNTILSFIILFYLLAYIVIWPFAILIIAIISLVRALKALKNPEKAVGKVCGGLLPHLGFVITTMLMLTFLPHMVLGSGMKAIFTLCIISIVVNLVASRLRAYNSLDFKYVNLVQGTALIQLAGFVVFFTNVLKTGFLHKFISSMSDYLAEVLPQVASINTKIDLQNRYGNGPHLDSFTMRLSYLIDLGLMIVAAVMALSVCVSLIQNIAAHLGLSTNGKKISKPGSLGNGISAAIVCALPIVVSKLQNKIFYPDSELKDGVLYVTEEVKGAIFAINDDGMSALTGMIIGTVLILAGAIAFMVLKKVFCADITAEQEELILRGNAAAYAEAVAEKAEEAAPVADEAVAAAVVEEAPAEAVEAAAEEAAPAEVEEVVEEAAEEAASDETETV